MTVFVLCQKLKRDRLNVSTANFDKALRAVQTAVGDSWDKVDILNDFTDLVMSYENQCGTASDPGWRGGSKKLDLVAHSAGTEHLLKLGTWLIDPASVQAFSSISKTLRDLHITSLRLLGCFTARMTTGLATIRKLGTQLNMKVYGTNTYLSACDFNEGGFNDDPTKLVSSSDGEAVGVEPLGDELPIYRGCASETGSLGLGEIQDFSESELRDLRGVTWPHRILSSPLRRVQQERIQGLVYRPGWALQGLLTVPYLEYWIPVDSEERGRRDRYLLMQILFNWQMLRVFLKTPTDPTDPDPFASPACYHIPQENRKKLIEELGEPFDDVPHGG